MSTLVNTVGQVALRTPGVLVRSWDADGQRWHLLAQPVTDTNRESGWQNFRLVRDLPSSPRVRRVWQLAWSPSEQRLAGSLQLKKARQVAPLVVAMVTWWLSERWTRLIDLPSPQPGDEQITHRMNGKTTSTRP